MNIIKWSLLLTIMAYAGSVFAYEVPKDATIKVYDAKGRLIGEMNRKDYKVVKVGSKKSVKKIKKDEMKNSFIFHGGAGKDGIRSKSIPEGVEVKEEVTPVVGFSVCRSKDSVGLCASAFSHGTLTLGIKKDF